MCRHCNSAYAASLAPASMAITNPALVWSQVQEQKQIRANTRAPRRGNMSSSSDMPTTSSSQTDPAHSQQQKQDPNVMSSAASTYSASTSYSYDKEKQPLLADQKKAKKDKEQKRKSGSGSPPGSPSFRQKVREVIEDLGGPPTARYDREQGQETKNINAVSAGDNPLNRPSRS
ncbi:hypothetical protein F4780DRAFT_324887 [Xylariomycetidae sp. FL0641]|nr:hypothetical protein F4780DRAFT_324887 [Xylariomycetidae sp. FL0641]